MAPRASTNELPPPETSASAAARTFWSSTSGGDARQLPLRAEAEGLPIFSPRLPMPLKASPLGNPQLADYLGTQFVTR